MIKWIWNSYTPGPYFFSAIIFLERWKQNKQKEKKKGGGGGEKKTPFRQQSPFELNSHAWS